MIQDSSWSHKHLGICLQKKLNFKVHIETILCKVNKGNFYIQKAKAYVSKKIITNYLQSVFETPY